MQTQRVILQLRVIQQAEVSRMVVEGGTEESTDDGCRVMADLLDWFTDYY